MKEKMLSDLELSRLCRALCMTLHAGVGMGDALTLLASDESAGRLRSLLETMGALTDRGSALSAAMEETGAFPAYATGLIRVGEEAGRLEEALGALADYYEEREQMDWRLRNALTYPAILLLLMLTVIVVLLTRVLPVFEEVYASLGGRLTGLAGGLLLLGRGLNAAMPVLLVLLALAVVAVAVYALSPAVREKLLSLWRRRRGKKGLSRKIADARFAQGLALGLSSGLPLNRSLELAGNLLADTPAARERCRDCVHRLERGENLADALRDSGVLPAQSCRLLAMGLRGGSGDTAMAEIARRLAEEADRVLESRASRVEPALVLVASLLVGVILLAVMLPLLNIMSVIG